MRPRIPIDLESVRKLLAMGVPLAKIARDLGVDRSTIERRLKEMA